jgi:hypothetical protein
MDNLRLLRMNSYDGVAGAQRFDQTLNNIAPVSLARVENGKFVYWRPDQGQSASIAKP